MSDVTFDEDKIGDSSEDAKPFDQSANSDIYSLAILRRTSTRQQQVISKAVRDIEDTRRMTVFGLFVLLFMALTLLVTLFLYFISSLGNDDARIQSLEIRLNSLQQMRVATTSTTLP